MTYQVKFTETTNPAKPAITVADQTLNNQTSVTFVGKNYAGYAPIIAENFLHLLENFARSTSPANPVEGQLWYDNTAGVNLLKVYDGTSWNPAGNVKKAGKTTLPGGFPSVGSSTKGDLWVDTDNQQLYLFSGSNWLLIGPQYSEGLKTGPMIESIIATDNVSKSVISLYSEDYRIAVVSKEAFTPKATIPGFPAINQGITLSTVDAASTTAPTRFHGTATQADALLVNGSTVSSTNFLRSDDISTTNYGLNIRSSAGLSVGSDLSFNISANDTSTILQSKTSGRSIDIKMNNAGSTATVLHIDSNGQIGLGIDNTSPAEALDVDGNIAASGKLILSSTQDSTALGIGSISTAGGLSVAKKTNFGQDASIYGKLYVKSINPSTSLVDPEAILPETSNVYDIGSATRTFRNVYADSFVGTFNGTVIGSLSGSITGSAAKLASPTTFSLVGDVSSNAIAFDGQGDDPAVFTTEITTGFITSKELVTNSLLTDELLVYRPSIGLKRYTKQTLISNIPTVPVGAIFPFAGSTAPAGYLLCDGSEVRISTYSALYSVIGYTYKAASLLIGKSTFAVPDFRGRFGLGRDNMDNNLTVQDKTSPDSAPILIDAGGGSANRVTDIVADTLGAGSGTETKSLSVSNIPNHVHTLNSGNAQYYAAGIPGGPADVLANPGYGMPSSSTGYGLANSGGVDSPSHGTPFNAMNPYLTINYIIFTGVL